MDLISGLHCIELVIFPPEPVALADELGIPLVGRQVDGQGHDLQVDLDKLHGILTKL